MYDLIIIGSGWAGFNAAQMAKELNLKVALIERNKLGGTCLNLGCIPTKALIQSAKIFSLAQKAADFGVDNCIPAVNFAKIQERKDKIVAALSLGMQSMLKGVDFLSGEPRLDSLSQVTVNGSALKTKFILIATGSSALDFPGMRFDGKKIISSDEIIALQSIPRSLLIVGGGVIGCEFASLFSMLGTQVTVVEKTPRLLPLEDAEISKRIEGIFKKKGIKVACSTEAAAFNVSDFELVLIAVGRKPQCNIPGLSQAGVRLERGAVLVDDYLKAGPQNIYAAGDCTAKLMLAHFAGYQGRLAVENMFSSAPRKMRLDNVPNCIFTDPEVASVGLSEETAASSNVEVKAVRLDFMGLGMARVLGETQGFIKIICGRKDDRVLGACIVGPKATEIIGALSVAVSAGMTTEGLRRVIFAHPTISESVAEALNQADYGGKQ